MMTETSLATRIPKRDLVDAFAQSMGVEAGEEYLNGRIRQAALPDQDFYTLEELFRISAVLTAYRSACHRRCRKSFALAL